MIALYIIGGIVLLITIIMMLPVVFTVDYDNTAEVKARILFFDLFKEKKEKKPKKPKKTKKIKEIKPQPKPQNHAVPEPVKIEKSEPVKQQKIKKAKAEKPKKPKKQKPDIDFAAIKATIDSLAPTIKKLLRKTKIYELFVHSTVGGEDAAKAAMNYGLQSTAIYSALAWLKTITNVKVERIFIEADFLNEDTEINFHCKVKIKIGTLIVTALSILVKLAGLKASKNPAPPAARPNANIGKRINIIID